MMIKILFVKFGRGLRKIVKKVYTIPNCTLKININPNENY